jgi:hypothetical protein
VVHHAVQAVDRPRRHIAGTVLALICCGALLAACGGSSGDSKKDEKPAKEPVSFPTPTVGPVRSANCTDWKRGVVDERRSTVVALRNFAAGPVGSSAGIQRGPVLDDGRAYRVLQSFCKRYFARGFKLYKLYERAAAFVGR